MRHCCGRNKKKLNWILVALCCFRNSSYVRAQVWTCCARYQNRTAPTTNYAIQPPDRKINNFSNWDCVGKVGRVFHRRSAIARTANTFAVPKNTRAHHRNGKMIRRQRHCYTYNARASSFSLGTAFVHYITQKDPFVLPVLFAFTLTGCYGENEKFHK